MHEMSLCENVIQIVEDAAKAESFNSVIGIWIEVGSLAGVEISALEFCFDIIRQNSIAENATLHIIEVPALAWCKACKKNVEIQQRFSPCPLCVGHQLEFTSGDEMKIKELEVA